MTQKAKYLLIIALLLSMIIVPKIAFSSNNIYDSFNYSNTALAQTAINDEKIEHHPYENAGNSINRHANSWSGRWVVTSSIASISLVTGLSPRELQPLPICAIGILIMAYLVASKLTKDRKLAAVYTVLMAFDPTVNSLTNGTYIQGWGFIFYFMSIYTTMIIVERKHYLALIKKREHYKPFLLYGSLTACSLMMMHFSYYSALIYGVIMLAVVATGVMFTGSGRKLKNRHIALFISCMAIAFGILYLVEGTVRFAISNFQGLLNTFVNYAIDVIVTGGSQFYVGLLSYILIFTPICLLGYKWLRMFVRGRKLPVMTSNDLFISSFLLTGIINVVIYTGLGLVDFKYFIMFFSLSALYAVKRLGVANLNLGHITTKKLPVRQIFTVVLTMLFVLKFATYIAPVMADNSFDDSDGLYWLSDNCLNPGVDSISGLGLSGEIMLLHVEKDNSEFNSFVYSTNYLNSLTSGNQSEFLHVNGDITFLVMTERNMDGHFNIGNWETWGIEESPVDIIGHRTNFQRIYSSTELSVWRIYP